MKCSTKGAALRKEPHMLPFFYPLIQTQPRLLLILTVTRTFIIDKESQIRAKAKSLKKDALKKSGTRTLKLSTNFKERAYSLVVSSLRSKTKGSLFEPGC